MNIKQLTSVIMIAAIAFVLSGCSSKGKEKEADHSDLNKIIPVSVTTAQNRDLVNKRTYAGSLEGIKQSNIVAKIPERIVSISAEVGQFVNAGEVVIELDKTGPSSQFLQMQANLENVQRELDRMKALFSEGAVSKQVVDQTQTAYSVAKANFEAAKSAVQLVAPVSGRITAINVNTGDWVNPGMTLAVIADITQMIINFNVNESDIRNLKIGTPVKVYSEFSPETAQEGRITEIERSASLDARTFGVKAKFPNTKDSFYKPGMFVKADVNLESKQNVLTVPTSAVINEDNKNIVFTIKDNKSFSRNVTVGFSNEEYTEITGGLSAEEIVVTAGMNNLADSTQVSVTNKKQG